jgi:hypothetical protein
MNKKAWIGIGDKNLQMKTVCEHQYELFSSNNKEDIYICKICDAVLINQNDDLFCK